MMDGFAFGFATVRHKFGISLAFSTPQYQGTLAFSGRLLSLGELHVLLGRPVAASASSAKKQVAIEFLLRPPRCDPRPTVLPSTMRLSRYIIYSTTSLGDAAQPSQVM